MPGPDGLVMVVVLTHQSTSSPETFNITYRKQPVKICKVLAFSGTVSKSYATVQQHLSVTKMKASYTELLLSHERPVAWTEKSSIDPVKFGVSSGPTLGTRCFKLSDCSSMYSVLQQDYSKS